MGGRDSRLEFLGMKCLRNLVKELDGWVERALVRRGGRCTLFHSILSNCPYLHLVVVPDDDLSGMHFLEVPFWKLVGKEKDHVIKLDCGLSFRNGSGLA